MNIGNKAILTIDLDLVRDNYLLLDRLSGDNCETAAAVKANAYGLGAHEIVNTLLKAGCKTFFVAAPDEAIDIASVIYKKINGKKNAEKITIAVLGACTYEPIEEFPEINIIPVLNSIYDIEKYSAIAAGKAKKLPAILHFDTGMNRLGIDKTQSQTLLEKPDLLSALEIKTVMSHFTSADEKDNPSTKRQYQKLIEISQNYQCVTRSICNSSGIFRSNSYHMEMTRPGMAIYGLNPTPEQENPMRQTVSLHAPILQIRNVEAGETAGYNETYRFSEKTLLATVYSGYADGILRSLSRTSKSKNNNDINSGGSFYWKGCEIPICGRVSMDLVICDLGNVPESDLPAPGDMVEIIGKHQSPDQLAKAAGTIGYEILTSLGSRYHRIYKSRVSSGKSQSCNGE